MRPNIVYIHSHDTGRYVQPYGYAVPTPHYQRLAEQGVLFRHAHSGAPTCSPSRAALLTGQSAHGAGMLGLAHRGFCLRDVRQHLAHVLGDAGYATVVCGTEHTSDSEPGRAKAVGYQTVLACGAGGDAAGPMVDWLRAHAGGAAGTGEGEGEGDGVQPFYLDVGFFHTHRDGRGFQPCPAGESKTDPRYVQVPATLPDTPEVRADMAAYIDAARSLDAMVGQVIDAIDEMGLVDQTLIVLTTDHGIAFPGMKCSLTVHGTGVLLIMRGPGGFAGGQVVDALVSHVDVYATLCEVAGLAKPGWAEGESLLPRVRGEVASVREELFAEVTYHAAAEPMRCARTQRYVYIRRYGDRRLPVLPNCDDSASKDAWLAAGGGERVLPDEALYDTWLDPQERDNRVGDPSLAGVLAEMRGRLDGWMARTGDPLRDGVLPAVPGVKVNDPAGLSPTEQPRVL